jgi:pyridoxine kinase
VFSALFLGHYLRQRQIQGALERAASAMHALVERTVNAAASELRLVAAQDDFVAPRQIFRAERLA